MVAGMTSLTIFAAWCLLISLSTSASATFDANNGNATQLERLCPAASFVKWFDADAVERKHENLSGWGIYALKNIEKGHVIARIPLRECLINHLRCDNTATDDARACSTAQAIRSSLHRISNDADELALATYLALARDCDYCNEVKALAKHQHVAFSRVLVNRVLKPLLPELARRILTLDELIEKLYEELVKGKTHDNPTLDDLQMGMFAVTSRAFSLRVDPKSKDNTVVMVPCGDLFNHEENDDPIRYTVEDNEVVFTTRRAYSVGEELKVTYGPKSSEDLLFQYGFVLGSGSKYATVGLSFQNSSLWEQSGDKEVKKTILKRFTKPYGQVRLTSKGLTSYGLAVLRVLALPSNELSALNLANIIGRSIEAPSEESEARAALMLEMAVFNDIVKYKEVMEANEALISNNSQIQQLLIQNIRTLSFVWKRLRAPL